MFQKLAKTLKKAFTITELVIVIAVIAVLAAVLIPTFSNVISSANQSAALSTCKNALTDLEGTKANAGETSEDLYGTGFCCNGYYYVFFMGQLWYLGTIDLDASEVDRGEADFLLVIGGAVTGVPEDGERTKLFFYVNFWPDNNKAILSHYTSDGGTKTKTTYTATSDTVAVVYELSVDSIVYVGMFLIEIGDNPTYQTEGATYSSDGIIMDGSLLCDVSS